ncbi:MAG TPA: helix-turn-helix transcriptional regulator [Fimbriimonas sp.]|nr:helix-turn-helix transcriptional regulator [Fimbriimonas sp.]
MQNIKLSPREEEIIDLCLRGLTNEAIAHHLGIKLGTVNTYWLRIKLKVGGQGKADTVARVIRARADLALTQERTLVTDLREALVKKEKENLELRTELALTQVAMDRIQSTVWATDNQFRIYLLANGEFPSKTFGWKWEVGKRVDELFESAKSNHLAISAHEAALQGQESSVRLAEEYSQVILRVLPLREESEDIVGCVSIINIVEESLAI